MSIGKYIIRFRLCGLGKTVIGRGLWQIRLGIMSVSAFPITG
jgi:hypothetical protein